MSRRESLLSAPYQTRPPEGGARGVAGRAIRRVALAATIAALLTIVLGATVRATGAGDACGDDWPVCNGRIIPEFDVKVLTEYAHRLATPVLVWLIGWLAVLAWRRHRTERRLVWASTAAFGLLFVQAGLGALVVQRGLSPELVTLHLATAMLLVAALVIASASAWTLGRGAERTAAARRVWAAAGAIYAVILIGAYVRGEGAGLAFLDWPLMGGRVIPDFAGEPQVSMFVHRLIALIAVPVVAWIAARAWRERGERPGPAWFAIAALAALLAQIAVGAINVWTRLAAGARIAHVALAALTWAGLVAAAALSRTAPAEEPA